MKTLYDIEETKREVVRLKEKQEQEVRYADCAEAILNFIINDMAKKLIFPYVFSMWDSYLLLELIPSDRNLFRELIASERNIFFRILVTKLRDKGYICSDLNMYNISISLPEEMKALYEMEEQKRESIRLETKKKQEFQSEKCAQTLYDIIIKVMAKKLIFPYVAKMWDHYLFVQLDPSDRSSVFCILITKLQNKGYVCNSRAMYDIHISLPAATEPSTDYYTQNIRE